MQTSRIASATGHWEPDERAFAAALTRQLPSLKAYARRLTLAAADWEDLVQDTMVRCWAARRSFRFDVNFAGWARTVMRNCFLTDRRRARFHVDLPPDAIADMLSVGENQSAAVDLRDARWALGQLVPEQRKAVELLAEGVTFAEGAERLKIPEATFKSRAFRGRRRLRDLVEERSTPLLAPAPAREPAPFVPVPRLIPRETPRRRRDWTGVMIG